MQFLQLKCGVLVGADKIYPNLINCQRPKNHESREGNSGVWGLRVLLRMHRLPQSSWDRELQDSTFVLKRHTANWRRGKMREIERH